MNCELCVCVCVWGGRNSKNLVGVAGKPISSFTHLPMPGTENGDWRLKCYHRQFMWATKEFLLQIWRWSWQRSKNCLIPCSEAVENIYREYIAAYTALKQAAKKCCLLSSAVETRNQLKCCNLCASPTHTPRHPTIEARFRQRHEVCYENFLRFAFVVAWLCDKDNKSVWIMSTRAEQMRREE